jgi:hypothetical protein
MPTYEGMYLLRGTHKVSNGPGVGSHWLHNPLFYWDYRIGHKKYNVGVHLHYVQVGTYTHSYITFGEIFHKLRT